MSRRLTVLAVLGAVGLGACTSSGGDDVATSADAAATEQPAPASTASPATGEDAPTIVQPGAPGEPNRILSAEEAEGLYEDAPHTWADVRFMQMMVPHHAQALEMVAFVEDRTASEDLPLFARRLEISQEDELRQIRDWLEQRGEAVPDPADAEQMRALAAHQHGGDHSGDQGGSEAPAGPDDALMPGMLTEAEMAALGEASGAEFDRLWIESMIRHHEGALTMVDDLFTTEGAGQETEVFRFATHVVSDQQIEIARMHRMLAEMDATP